MRFPKIAEHLISPLPALIFSNLRSPVPNETWVKTNCSISQLCWDSVFSWVFHIAQTNLASGESANIIWQCWDLANILKLLQARLICPRRMVSEKHDECVTMETSQGVNYSKFNLTSPPSRPPLNPRLTGRVCISSKSRGVRHSLTHEQRKEKPNCPADWLISSVRVSNSTPELLSESFIHLDR